MGLSIEGKILQEDVEEDEDWDGVNQPHMQGEKKSFSSMRMNEGEDQIKWVGIGLNGIGKF